MGKVVDTAYGCFMTVFIVAMALCLFVCIATVSSDATDLKHIREDMRSVGIEKFVRCNNAHSNWVEIVWKSEVK